MRKTRSGAGIESGLIYAALRQADLERALIYGRATKKARKWKLVGTGIILLASVLIVAFVEFVLSKTHM